MSTMIAHRITGFGGPEVLAEHRVDVPQVGPGQLLVKVAYCGVCRHDLLTRAGAFPRALVPVTLGHQVSGWVAATGPDVRDFAVGDRVMTMIFTGCGRCRRCAAGEEALCEEQTPQFLGEDRDGGYAEYVVVEARTSLTVPATMPLAEAAIMTCTLGTAYHAVVGRGGVQAGDLVVVTGASGGVGVHAIEVLAMLGARAVGVVSSGASVGPVRQAGAVDVIVSPDRRFSGELRRRYGQADVVLDVVGEPTLNESCHAVRPGGRVVVIGNVNGRHARIPPAYLILKEIALVGTKSCSIAEMNEVLSLVAGGSLRARVDTVVPLAQCRAVHERMEAGENLGRIVLEVAGEQR
ncbi:alcohol dehydrogenase catalytic domain-containing protein [Flexivirga oryzae]|uniref:alcohol dehydrogenase n=1 Tax=Flexivirga oryzae TaxID=1794944 RepID=A0A839N8N5_9MICO|nr:alcohol dehydrogenase catalytic domain-containing protein [Flexivirga oryzae]MBB2893587.1 D-arabinose 1-dehydrogenase-like Zn-dependent alcohol dehydrogenase [Flexivirga oryzae]